MTLLTNITAYYPFDSNANDSVGSNNGTVSGATNTTGHISNCYSFDGINDYINLGSQLITNARTQVFSISVWVYYTNNGGNQTIYSQTSSSDVNKYITLFIDSSNNVIFGFRNGVGTTINYGSTGTVTQNQWVHIVLTKNGDTAPTLYIDNSSETMSTLANGGSTHPTTNQYDFGAFRRITPTNYHAGDLDEIGFWSKILTSGEVSQLYNSGSGLAYPFSVGRKSVLFIGGNL